MEAVLALAIALLLGNSSTQNQVNSDNISKEKEIYEMTLENGVDWILKKGFESVSIEYKLTLPLKII